MPDPLLDAFAHLDLDALCAEADELEATEGARLQPPGGARELAEELLGDGAPWHHIAHVAHAIEAEQQ